MENLKDKKIILYKRSEGMDADGYASVEYKPIHADAIWAHVRQTSGREYYAAMALQVEEDICFTVNWREELTPAAAAYLYVLYKGQWYNVQRIDTYEGYKDDVRLYAASMATPPASQIKTYE